MPEPTALASSPTTTYRWRLLRAGEFRLDGGSMFGLIPRVVWSKSVPTDDRGRINVQHNCLLLERATSDPASSLPSPKLILIEAGSGDKLDAKNRDIFAPEDRTIETALNEVNCRPQDIEAAVVTHLHFDHAGGLTRLARPGETADWTGPGSGGGQATGVTLVFPNARIHSQAREWEDARLNRSVMTRTYFPDHLEPLKDHVQLCDSARPFATGSTPNRGDQPLMPQEARETEVAPGVFVFLTPGHTWGQQAVRFVDTEGRHIVFTPDVLPTAAHVGQAYNMGYDVEPYTSTISRTWFLETAAEKKWHLCLDHEPGDPVRRVERNDKGWYTLVPTGLTGST